MKRAFIIFAAVAMTIGLAFAQGAQEKKPADKYAPFCGQYRFDLSSYGIGVITAKVYTEAGDIYIWADTSDEPDKMSPVENSDTKFFLDDPNEGHWDFEFLKDDKGKFTKCRIVNAGAGIDAVGEKIDG